MAIFYANDKVIEKVEMKNINKMPRDVKNNGHKLPSELITDSLNFKNLYDCWLSAGVDFMWYNEHGRSQGEENAPKSEHERIITLFYQGAEDEIESFLKKFTAALTTPKFPNIGDKERAMKICSYIDEQLSGVPAHMRLRCKAVCLFTDSYPQEIFAGSISIPPDNDDILAVKNGMSFTLGSDLAPGQELVPKTLKNESDSLCTILFRHGEKDYSVKIPPYGIIRAVFSNSECKDALSLKGNISCDDTVRAIIQKGDEKNVNLVSVNKSRLYEYTQVGFFLDASADEGGGAVILTPHEIYSTINELSLKKSQTQLPIRCFRSGNQWARIHSDGRLESNLERGKVISGVTAVVEDGERGLLVCTQDGTWDYRYSIKKEISVEEFYSLMVSRFSYPKYCETVETQFMRISVKDDGEVEVVKNE